MTYHFEHRNDSNKKNLIKIRAPDKNEFSDDTLVDLDDFEPEKWSSKFTIEDIDEFQVTLQDTPSLNIVPRQSVNKSILKNHSKAPKKPSWDNPHENNSYRRFIKVSIKTEDEATIFVIFSQPNMPEYRINNFSETEVHFYQDNLKDYEIKRFCKPADTYKVKKEHRKYGDTFYTKPQAEEQYITYPVPYCWDDQTINNRKLVLEIDNKEHSYEIEEIEEKKPIVVNGYKYYISVITNGFYREVQIRQVEESQEEEEKLDPLKQIFSMSDTKTNGINLIMNFRGIGVSIVDEEPKELIYISIFKIDCSFIQDSKSIDFSNKNLENQEEIDLTIAHVQIDNVISKENPIILSPELGLDKNSYLTAVDYTPFIQLKLSQTIKEMNGTIQRTIEALQVQIQSIYLE